MNHHHARINMIKQQLRTCEVLSESVLDLFEAIPRHHFVPQAYTAFAYSDMQIPLPYNQRMMTPLEEATIIQALNLKGTETVLEIGTGTGFLTALLSQLCKQVISLDIIPEFVFAAERKLQAHHCNNVELVTGNGCRGWLEQAPYDVIVFTGSLDKITETQKLQIVPEGKLFTIEGKSPIMQANLYTLDHDNNWGKSMLFETDIPPLLDQIKPKVFIF